MAHSLETAESLDELYLARTEDVRETRPIFTGDIFRLGEPFELAIALEHPCNMRVDGVALKEKLLIAEVTPHDHIGNWDGHYRRMPLPQLIDNEDHAASFDDAAFVDSEALEAATREAVMQLRGINLLHQRWVHHLTRAIIPTFTFREEIIGELTEIDLMEEWAETAVGHGVAPNEAWGACHEWLREGVEGDTRQRRLRNPEYRVSVVRECREQGKNFYANT